MRRWHKYENLERRDLLTFAFTYEHIDLPIEESHLAREMKAVDLNGDEHLDLLIATSPSNVATAETNIDAFLRTTSGYQLVGREQFPIRAQLASHVDLDGDGKLDLVVYTGQSVVSFLNRGTSQQDWLGFEFANSSNELMEVWKVEPGNFDGDPFGDLVVGVGDEIQVRLGRGDGTFENGARIALSEYRPPRQTESTDRIIDQRSFDVGDANSDGFDDLALSAANEHLTLGASLLHGTTVTFINDGSGSFVAEVHEGESGDVFFEDIDRDGDLDLLVSSEIESHSDFLDSRVLIGDGIGSFALDEADCCVRGRERTEAADGNHIYTLDPIDLGGGSVLFFEDENVGIDLHPWNGWPPVMTQIVDLDSDGKEEIVVPDGKGVGVLSETLPSPLIEAEPRRVSTGERLGKFIDDFDLDGHVDIVAIKPAESGPNQYQFSVEIRWGEVDGPSESLDSFSLDLGETNPYFDLDIVLGKITDVNEDEFPDIQIRVDGGILSILNTTARGLEVGPFEKSVGTYPFPDSEVPIKYSGSAIAAGDINGDGFPEKVTVHDAWFSGLVTVQRGVSENQLEDVGITQVFPKPIDLLVEQVRKKVALWDMTGDGVLDVVYSDFATADVLIFTGIADLATGDLNGDEHVDVKDLDLLVAIASARQVDSNVSADLNRDRQTDSTDVDIWVRSFAETEYGDTNLDRRIDFADFLIVRDNFGREDASWSDGDFDGDGEVGFTDFLALSTNFGFGTA